MRALSAVVEQEPKDSLGLADMRGTVLSKGVVSMLKKSVPSLGKRIYKAAVVMSRINGFRKVIFDAVVRVSGRNVALFVNIEEAQNWLVGE